MELSDVMRTTGAVRSFTDEPVTDATLRAVLDDARFAPSGGNRQGWRVAVVRDAALRRRLAEACAPVWNEYVAQSAAGETPFSVTAASSIDLVEAQRTPAPNPLLDELEGAPVWLVVAVDMGALAVMDRDLARPSIVGGASIYPFCQNILLAARAHGLGGVMSTFVVRVEPELAEPLGLPEGHALAAMIVLGHPVHQPTQLRRNAVEDFTTVDRFDGPVFEG